VGRASRDLWFALGAIRGLGWFALRALADVRISTCGSRTAVGVFLQSPSLDFALPASLRLSKYAPGAFVFVRAKKSTQKKHAPVAAPLGKAPSGPLRSSVEPRASRTRRRAKDHSARSGSTSSRDTPQLALRRSACSRGGRTTVTTNHGGFSCGGCRSGPRMARGLRHPGCPFFCRFLWTSKEIDPSCGGGTPRHINPLDPGAGTAITD
jgi:hypothetical protein